MPNTPSLKHRRVYEALRRKGMSKTRAARISNAQKESGTTGLAIPPTGPRALFNQMGIASRRRRRRKEECTCAIVTKATGQPGELIKPGVRRIRGNLCNVHGRYGACDTGASGAKPKGSRRAPKPKQTPAQRAQARQQQRDTNSTNVAQQMADNDTGLSPSGSKALLAFAKGTQPDSAMGGQLAKMGLAEQASDGSYRMTPTGRAVVSAMAAGDYQRAVDAVSRGTDSAGKRGERTAAQQTRQETARKRQQDAAGKRATSQLDRTLSKRQQAARPAKDSSGGKQPAAHEAIPAQTRTAKPARRAARSSAPKVGSVGALDRARPKPTPAVPKAPAKQIAPALRDAATQLSEGTTPTDEQMQALITNGLVRLNKDGVPVLTVAGQRATQKAASGHTGVMIALYPDAAAAKQIAAQDGVSEPTDHLHLTLAFLGDSSEVPLSSNKDKLIAALKQWAIEKGQPLEGTVNGLGRFFHSEDDNTNAVYLSPDVPGLPELRQSLIEWIEQSGFDYAQNHGFTPHITVAYVPLDAPTPAIRVESPIVFNHVTLAWGDERYDYPLGTAAQKEPSSVFSVFKDSRGADRWLGITTTAYLDIDDEIISTKAIGQAVAIGDLTGQRGPLDFWHVPGMDIGDCDYQAQGGPGGRFLIESGTFRSKACARLGQKMAEKGYQMSPAFVHARTQPRHGIYDDIAIYARSPVPNGRAANRFTKFATKEDRMLTTEKEAELKTLLADQPDLLNQLMAQVERTDKAAQAIGVTYKDAPEWAQSLITRIDGLEATVKAFTPASAEQAGETEIMDAETEQADDGEMEPDGDEGGMDDAAFAQMIAKAVVQAITPLFDIEKKMAGHLNDFKTAMGGAMQQKDDATAAEKIRVDALEAKLKELTGDLPSSVLSGAAQLYRASESPLTRLTTEGEAKVKERLTQIPAGLSDAAEIGAYQLIFGSQ